MKRTGGMDGAEQEQEKEQERSRSSNRYLCNGSQDEDEMMAIHWQDVDVFGHRITFNCGAITGHSATKLNPADGFD